MCLYSDLQYVTERASGNLEAGKADLTKPLKGRPISVTTAILWYFTSDD
jgi:hypothetical protein